MRLGDLPTLTASRLQLYADRKRPDTFSRCRKDRVDQCRRKGRHAGFADARGRGVGSGRHDVYVGHERSLVDPNQREIIEIALLDLAVLEGDLPIFGKAQAHDRRALDLRANAFWVDVGPAIDRGIHPGDRQLALVVDRYFDDGRDIADEAAVNRNT